MTVFIDADSCPATVRNHVVKLSNEKNIPVIFAANRKFEPENGQIFQMKVCETEKDAADNFIVENSSGAVFSNTGCADDRYGFGKPVIHTPEELVKAGSDVVVTRDLLLAKRLVEKNICAMNDRGTFFTAKNIDRLLKEREEDLQYVAMGLVKHAKGSTYNKKEFADFANSFDKIINLL